MRADRRGGLLAVDPVLPPEPGSLRTPRYHPVRIETHSVSFRHFGDSFFKTVLFEFWKIGCNSLNRKPSLW